MSDAEKRQIERQKRLDNEFRPVAQKYKIRFGPTRTPAEQAAEDPVKWLAELLRNIHGTAEMFSKPSRIGNTTDFIESCAFGLLRSIAHVPEVLKFLSADERFTHWSGGNLVDRISHMIVVSRRHLEKIEHSSNAQNREIALAMFGNDNRADFPLDDHYFAGLYGMMLREIDGVRELADELEAAAQKPFQAHFQPVRQRARDNGSGKLFDSGHDETEGDWCDPVPLAKIATAINQSPEKAKEILAKTGLKQKTRQAWICRYDRLTSTWADRIQADCTST